MYVIYLWFWVIVFKAGSSIGAKNGNKCSFAKNVAYLAINPKDF
jgi:hypothetical protein